VRLTNAVSNFVHELRSVVYVHAVPVKMVSFCQFEGSRNKAVATELLVLKFSGKVRRICLFCLLKW